MNWLNRLPGFERSPPGREWWLWKRLPAILGWGTALPLAVAFLFWWFAPAAASAADERALWLLIYQLLGLVLMHWTLVLTAAIACAIVMLMKGPAYVADSYPPPGRET